ncbi:MAG: lipid-A-disaccharide synthase [Firmicutes bacterium]|nr:lipid-A-disaccharide synthase [Bacillota bacterium]
MVFSGESIFEANGAILSQNTGQRMKRPPVIFLSTCEFSGDMHGAVLLQELQKILPEAVYYGIGGPRMKAAGMGQIYDPTRQSTIGFTEIFKNLGQAKQVFNRILAEWEKRRPDIMIWLDSGGFNLPLAKAAKERGIPVVCMFSPSAWAYNQGRAVKLAQRVELLLAVLPFEAGFYQKFGAKAEYVGHPLIDKVKNSLEPAGYRRQLNVGANQRLVALLPGSRRQEITNLLPVMLKAAEIVDQGHEIKWVLPLAQSLSRDFLEAILAKTSVKIEVIGQTDVYNLLAAADAAVISSGTATLEAAILNTPMIIIYRVSKLSYLIYKMMQNPSQRNKPDMVGLPNWILGKIIVPEFTQNNLTSPNIATALEELLEPARNQELRQCLSQVKTMIGPPGVMPRAAIRIVELLNSSL